MGALIACLVCVAPVRSYQVGSPLPLLIRTPSGTVDALRNQMPLFGVPTSATVGTDTLKPPVEVGRDRDSGFESWKKKLSVSLSFGGGAAASFGERSVSAPWADVFPEGRVLERLTFTFVFCRDGDLHSVSSRASYIELTKADEDAESHFRVEYVWVEEADVDIAGGMTIIMALVLLASLFILVGACGDMRNDIDEEHKGGAKEFGARKDYGYEGYSGGNTWKGE